MLALTCGVALIGVAFIGESTRAEYQRMVEQKKPKPDPQMMAPAPSHGDSSGMVYAVGTTYVDARGGY